MTPQQPARRWVACAVSEMPCHFDLQSGVPCFEQRPRQCVVLRAERTGLTDTRLEGRLTQRGTKGVDEPLRRTTVRGTKDHVLFEVVVQGDGRARLSGYQTPSCRERLRALRR